jgi:type IV pilus assembly protein PilC
MPTFMYTARDKQGRLARGHMDATSQDTALATLQGKGFLVTSITVKLEGGVKSASRRRKMHTRVTLMDQILLCQQVGTMLNAGVPLLRCLEVMQKQIESKRLQSTMHAVVRDVEAGMSFHDALSKHPKIFSPYWLNLVETGESSGHLGDTLEQLATFLERSRMLREKLATALVYPAVLIVMAVAAIVFFSMVVVPQFEQLFASFDAELPAMTQFVIAFGAWMRNYFFLVAAGVAGCVWLGKQYTKTPHGRFVLDSYTLKIPILGALFYNVQIARFSIGLATLLESGVPILYALEILERSADNVIFGRALSQVKTDVREGKPMAVPLEETALFPPMVVQMVQVGEEIGELSIMLNRIASYYEGLINTLSDRLAVLFEPIALVGVGSIIGFLVVALFMPLFDIASKVH